MLCVEVFLISSDSWNGGLGNSPTSWKFTKCDSSEIAFCEGFRCLQNLGHHYGHLSILYCHSFKDGGVQTEKNLMVEFPGLRVQNGMVLDG